MKILIKEEKSHLNNSCVRWYLAEEKLWITMFKEYKEIEKSIRDSVGSFNWLYEINDTVLFRKGDGRFETAIIDLSGKISLNRIDSSIISKCSIQKGNLYVEERVNTNFEFPESINYIESKDCLVSLSNMLGIEKITILFILDDFGFVIFNNQLNGWILKNASKYICTARMEENIYLNNVHLLSNYFKALRMWEENNDNIVALKEILEKVKLEKDVISVAIKECIINIV